MPARARSVCSVVAVPRRTDSATTMNPRKMGAGAEEESEDSEEAEEEEDDAEGSGVTASAIRR